MKRIFTTLALFAAVASIMAQGIRIHYKHYNNSPTDWNYNDFDSIVVDYSSKVSDLYRTLPVAIKENTGLSLFSQALEATGVADAMQQREDYSWTPSNYEDRHVFTGTQYDYCHVPQQRRIRYTAFVCPDSILEQRHGITSLQGLYDYARSLYGGEALDVTKDTDKLRETGNPLRRLIAYNCLQSCPANYDMYTTICTIATELVDPTEWYATLDGAHLLKMERLTVSHYVGSDEIRNDLYLNRSNEQGIPGIHVARQVGNREDFWGSNGTYYLTDGLADLSTQTQKTVFNARIRMDLYTLFPEMMNNNIRDGRTTNSFIDSDNPNISVTSPNYWFPKGYIENVKVNDATIFCFQSQHNTYWSYKGDEFFLVNPIDKYDMTLKLPQLPDGHYQLRLGFTNMQNRPVCQFYVDDVAVGIPLDMTENNFETRSGWFALRSTNMTDEEKAEAKRKMHNLGWYHGPSSVFSMNGEGHPDGSNNRGYYFCDNARTSRYVIGDFDFKAGEQHTLRIKSVQTTGTAILQLDYLEFVPKSVYEGDEDDY